MVNPGGETTMLGQWRIVIKQAEDAARAGRFDEALALATRPDIADHRQAVQLRNKLAKDLVGRASRRLAADDADGAIADLFLAESHGAPPDLLAEARRKVCEAISEDVRAEFDAGDPAKVLVRVARLAEQHVSGPALRRMKEAAEAWKQAIDDGRRGEFGLACEGLDRASRLAGGLAVDALASAKADLAQRREQAAPRVERLYSALGSANWAETLAAAESVLDVIPDHPAARQARSRAWQQIGALNPGASLPGRSARPNIEVAILNQDRARPTGKPGIVFLDEGERSTEPIPGWMPPRPRTPLAGNGAGPRLRPIDRDSLRGRFLLWADVIGGYLVCLNDEIVLGRAGVDSQADVALLGDLSRQHATVIRDGDGYIVKAHHPTYLNGKKIDLSPLRNGDVLRLGSTVELEFHQPSPVSSTARLEIVSRHRLPLAVDGVILMAETCIVGPSPQAHIPAASLESPVVLYRQGGGLWCRASGEFEVDGESRASRAPLTLRSNVQGSGFAFSLEPLPPQNSPA
jgi:hypothetical protein